MNLQQGPTPIIFGETLFDIFPDGTKVLGGAPFNVAWNLTGLGLEPLFISRLGDDEPGAYAFTAMRRFGLNTQGVQVDKRHPTGMVEIKISGPEHSFDIKPDQAYDFIDGAQARAGLESAAPSMLYHGTLALRSTESKEALNIIQKSSGVPVFVDVNLRAPWSDGALAIEAMKSARWAKLNDDEFYEILGGCSFEGENLEATADYLREETGLELLIITLGAQGAIFVKEDKIIREQPAPTGKPVDTVGAGDAFSAVTMMGLALGWPIQTTMTRALQFASSVCGIRGATTERMDFYSSFTKKWQGQR